MQPVMQTLEVLFHEDIYAERLAEQLSTSLCGRADHQLASRCQGTADQAFVHQLVFQCQWPNLHSHDDEPTKGEHLLRVWS